MMKKILFSAAATLAIVGTTAAFAASGSWYVLADVNTHACYEAPRTASMGEQVIGGPFASQTDAQSAMGGIVQCGSIWEP